MFSDLLADQVDGTLTKLIQSLSKINLLVVDGGSPTGSSCTGRPAFDLIARHGCLQSSRAEAARRHGRTERAGRKD